MLSAALVGALTFGVAFGVALRTPSVAAWTSRVASRQAACSERVHDRLFFGLRAPEGLVSDAEWSRFLAEVITPRFPSGLTVVEASGQWTGVDRQVSREPTRVVEITYDDRPEAAERIDQIVAAYKERHHQESVMVARARVEVCF